jgi:ketosteroid isomerase-like protein
LNLDVDKAAVDLWLNAYVDAWTSYDTDEIAALFADDVRYRYHPYDEPIEGRDAVVASWLGEGDFAGASTRDEPGTYTAGYRAIAVDGDNAVAVGTTWYRETPGGPVEDVYDNCFVMRFDADGRCSEFTEWFVKRPSTARPAQQEPAD